MVMMNLLWIIPLGMLIGTMLLRLIAWFTWGRKLDYSSNLNESGSRTGYLELPFYRRDTATQSARTLDEALNLIDPQGDSLDDVNTFGSSGTSPGGVPYTQVVGVGPIAKGRKMIGKK